MKEKTKNKLTKILLYSLAIITVAIIQLIAVPKMDNFILELVLFLGLTVISLYLTIIIHELGHLVFGLITGYKFKSIKIGIFQFEISNNVKKFKINKSFALAGFVTMILPEMDDEGNYPFLLYNYGGIIFNTITSIISIVLAFYLSGKSFTRTFILMMAYIGLLSAIMNLIPSEKDNIKSDGFRIQKLKNNIDFKKANWVISMIDRDLSENKRISEMDERYYSILESLNMENIYDDMILVNFIDYLLLLRLLENHNFVDAELVIDELLDNPKFELWENYKERLIIESIFIDILNGKDKEYIDNRIDIEGKGIIVENSDEIAVKRLKYAYELLVNKNIIRADIIKNDFDSIVNKEDYRQDFLDEIKMFELIEEIKEKTEE